MKPPDKLAPGPFHGDLIPSATSPRSHFFRLCWGLSFVIPAAEGALKFETEKAPSSSSTGDLFFIQRFNRLQQQCSLSSPPTGSAALPKLNVLREAKSSLFDTGEGNPVTSADFFCTDGLYYHGNIVLCRLWNFHLNGVKKKIKCFWFKLSFQQLFTRFGLKLEFLEKCNYILETM